MKTLDEIVNNYEEWSVFLGDRFGVRLAPISYTGTVRENRF